MTTNPIIKIIRAKKLGILIKDARQKSGKTLDQCARAMGITPQELAAVEAGERPPTLPELEILAYQLDVPLAHFWENQVLKPDDGSLGIDPQEIKQTRQKAIGDLILQGRQAAKLSVEELAGKAGLAPENLQAYEQGERPIPLPELETLAQVLNNSIIDFEDHEGPLGSKFTEKRNTVDFLELPPDLREFVSRPINRPYLELAVKLSEMKVEKLRELAEGLLEITL